MWTYQNPLCGIGLATIAFTLLSVPTVAMAQMDQQKPTTHVAGNYANRHASHQWRPAARPNLYNSARRGPTWPYQNQFPPYMSTFPEGSPNYHGPRPGPTFDNE
jgi:hypothetical protein